MKVHFYKHDDAKSWGIELIPKRVTFLGKESDPTGPGLWIYLGQHALAIVWGEEADE